MKSKQYKLTGIKDMAARQYCGTFTTLAAARAQIESKRKLGWGDFIVMTVINGREVGKKIV